MKRIIIMINRKNRMKNKRKNKTIRIKKMIYHNLKILKVLIYIQD